MKNKRQSMMARAPKIAALAVLLLFMTAQVAGADNVGAEVQLFCGSLINTGTPILGVTSTPNSVTSSLTSLINVSILILLVMLNVAAFTYLLGSALGIRALSGFGKTELGEVAVSALVVFLFLGSFAAINSLPPSNNYFALANNQLGTGIFTHDCDNFAYATFESISYVIPIYLAQDVLAFSIGINWGFNVVQIGYSVSPLAGLSISSLSLGSVTNILYVAIAIPVAGAVILALFYAIGPLFLFLGIILRTLPWTRAAGGTFLALFLAFYILFPLLLYVMMGGLGHNPNVNFSDYTPTQLFQNVQPGINWAPGSASLLGFGIMLQVISSIIAENYYVLFTLIFSLIISFDFLEAAGDLLGAPSLSSSQTLKGLI